MTPSSANHTLKPAHAQLRDARDTRGSHDYTRNADQRILTTLAGLSAHYGKKWCCPSQAKILELLRKFHGRSMSRRSLNRHLGSLERDFLIRRIRRHKRGRGGKLILHSTVYVILGRALQRFSRLTKWFRLFLAPISPPKSVLAVPQLAQNPALLTQIVTPKTLI